MHERNSKHMVSFNNESKIMIENLKNRESGMILVPKAKMRGRGNKQNTIGLEDTET